MTPPSPSHMHYTLPTPHACSADAPSSHSHGVASPHCTPPDHAASPHKLNLFMPICTFHAICRPPAHTPPPTFRATFHVPPHLPTCSHTSPHLPCHIPRTSPSASLQLPALSVCWPSAPSTSSSMLCRHPADAKYLEPHQPVAGVRWKLRSCKAQHRHRPGEG